MRETTFEPADDEVVVRTAVSAINAGTERLIYSGQAPSRLPADDTIDALAGDLSYPLRYGYAAVGEVIEAGEGVDGEWLGRTVFAFNPHESYFSAKPSALIPVPGDIDPEAMAILPSVETAVSLVLDGRPRLAERVVVFGAGVIGLCTLSVLASFPLTDLVAVDPVAERRRHARRVGASIAVDPADLGDVIETETGGEPDGADLIYELSGQPAALDDAVSVAGYDSRIVVGSWYGTKAATLDLGSNFHRDRISIESSQVSTIAPASRGRWSKQRRIEAALDRLRALETARLITHELPFREAPAAYRLLTEAPEETLQVLLRYA